jgi:hypothetical protein
MYRWFVFGVAWPRLEYLLGEVVVLDIVWGVRIRRSDDHRVLLLELTLVQLVLIFGNDDDGFLREAPWSASGAHD